MKNTIKPNARQKNIVIQEIADELLIYDLLEDKAFCLNKTSSLIWKMCDGNKTVSEIADQLSTKINSLVSEETIWLAICQFKEDGLLENRNLEIKKLVGMSRRKLIKKVGLTSAIALPIISSMMVPKPVAAQSCIDMFQTCSAVAGPPCCMGLTCTMVSPGVSICQ